MYYPAAGGGVLANIDAFIVQRPQLLLDAATSNVAAIAARNAPVTRPPASTLLNS